MKKTEKDVVCGPGCDCGNPSGNKGLKVAICLVVLLAVGSIFAYKAMNKESATPVVTATAFADPIANEASQRKPDAAAIEKEELSTIPAKDEEITEQPTTAKPVDKQEPAVKAVEEKSVGDSLDSLASLNTVAVNQDAVFVFLPAKGSDLVGKETTDAIASAEQKIKKATGAKIGLYTLKSGSQEYANLAAQLPLPGMLIMSKGRGMGAVSGGITEEKILQAYVASSQAGGCGPSGCGPSGCGPAPVGPRVQ